MFCIIRLDAHFGTNPQNLKIQHVCPTTTQQAVLLQEV